MLYIKIYLILLYYSIIKPKTIDKISMVHAIKSHMSSNNKYDKNKPYYYHLKMAVDIGKRFLFLIPIEDRNDVIGGIWEHDTIEDVSFVNYNDIKNKVNIHVAELAFACTNEKGKTRKERANDKYYNGIKNTKYATFIKLCDRIANVSYSLKNKNKSFYFKYKNEHDNFKKKLCNNKFDLIDYEIMWSYLDNIFKNN